MECEQLWRIREGQEEALKCVGGGGVADQKNSLFSLQAETDGVGGISFQIKENILIRTSPSSAGFLY